MEKLKNIEPSQYQAKGKFRQSNRARFFINSSDTINEAQTN